MKPALWNQELSLPYKYIVGVDEVGRGCWAGPLVSVAYRFFTIPSDIEVGDSKTVSEPRRNELSDRLKNLGEWGIGEVSSKEIDRLGLSAAQLLSYSRAVCALPQQPDVILLDGRPVNWPEYNVISIVDGDARVASIAAASLLAKVYRDTYMKTVAHEQYPDYGFNSHVGYGTKQHQSALSEFGITPLHRKSYKPIQNYLK